MSGCVLSCDSLSCGRTELQSLLESQSHVTSLKKSKKKQILLISLLRWCHVGLRFFFLKQNKKVSVFAIIELKQVDFIPYL